MLSFLHLIAVGIAGVTFRGEVAAQATTSAICVTATWTFNQQQQSPCLVAAFLQSTCNAGTWSVPALPVAKTSRYAGPDMGQSSHCQCSTVVYSVLAACGLCQGSIYDSWTDWKTNCTQSDISIASFPLTIPDATTVPSWAYLDVTVGGVWDSTAALNTHNAGAPDSSAIAPTATSAPSSTSSSSNNSSNTGAIAGGVVGGVSFLALLGIVGYMVLRRMRNRAPYSPRTRSSNGEKVDLVGTASPPPPPTPMLAYPAQVPPKFYDPDDPSTFPPTPSPSYFPSMGSPTISSVLSPTGGPHSHAGSYSVVSPGASSFVGSQLSDVEYPRAAEV